MSVQLNRNEIMSRIISQNEKVLYQNQEVISQNKILLDILQKNPEALPEDNSSLFETDSLTEEQTILSNRNTDIDTVSSNISNVSYADSDSSYADSGSSYTDSGSSYADSGSSYADTESLVSEVSSVLPKRKLKKYIKKLPSDFLIIDEEKNSYTPEEVEEMNDCELSINFSRIVGQNQLYCNHCHRKKSLEYWIHSIRKRCLKKDGLCATMTVPKTCDHQQSVNSICNPVNNRVYPTMRNPNTSERTKQAIMEAKAMCFEKMGKEINPYKYIPVAEPIAQPITQPITQPTDVSTKLPDELSSKIAEFKSLANIYKTKKEEYDSNKTKELKNELLIMKSDAKKLLLEIKELKAVKEGK
jgi:hypothetical protein